MSRSMPAGMLLGMTAIPTGSADITDAIASHFGIRRFQAERLKCVSGSAIASPTDHREMIPVNGPGEEHAGPMARHADDKNRIPRAELVSVITGELGPLDRRSRQSAEGAGLYRPARAAGGADRRRGGTCRHCRLRAGRAGQPVRIGRPPRFARPARSTRRARLLDTWRAWCSMLPPIRSISARSARRFRP